ncbi:MAG: LysM peptidoglycan-binding domain-containing protein [candidate division KSB1 bacterium]|nr:LysM peptidoglycan-binding domain-containing protein [candidate division KSB1 bacterium]MDZ7335461.1 LysM peptidoglycan-binding domain-containing protein [candidate division KSB1 bacterium]MDZ7358761.1 LysM peptidoglycan-binding domain-containing protein [candidate division KSB1 bacterium]MDZ7400299.1 LysM peptidoglycan-binding domain-containing protein [candidate division KSB1 bacterium]
MRKTLNQNTHSRPTPSRQSDPEQARQIALRVERHVLKNGETLQDLAIQYKTDQISILKANGIENWDQVQPGQTILIPINEPLTE